jgi:hypothetical protein
MSLDPAVPRKLGLTSGMRALLVNAPTAYAVDLVGAAGDVEIEATDGDGLFEAESFDLVQVFAANRAELERFGETAIAAVKRGGRLWVCYPKGGSGVKTDLNRDVDWGPFVVAGLRPVTQVAIDAVWSALRFRPVSEVGTKAP